MDLIGLHVLSGVISVVVQMAATIVALLCIVSFFSYKPGSSTKFFYVSLTYFLLSYAVLFVSAIMLEDITGPVPLFRGVGTLFMGSLINLAYAILIIGLYIRTVVFE